MKIHMKWLREISVLAVLAVPAVPALAGGQTVQDSEGKAGKNVSYLDGMDFGQNLMLYNEFLNNIVVPPP